MTKKKAFIFDVDGTLALHNGRGPFEYHKLSEDRPNMALAAVYRSIRSTGFDTVIMSGRPDTYMHDTRKWLMSWGFYHDALFMRPEAEMYVKDSIIKEKLYREFVEPVWDIVAVFDDRNQVVDMWRSLGLPCYQVAPGDF